MHRFLLIFLLIGIQGAAQAPPQDNHPQAIFFEQPEAVKKGGVKSVRCSFKDSRGLMWFGTSNGLFRFDGTTVLYRRKQLGNTKSLPDNIIVNITEDKKGNLWIGTFNGVVKMNAYNLECFNYTRNNKLLPQDFDTKVFCDKNGEIWVGSNKGLFVLDSSTNKFVTVWNRKADESENSEYITCIIDYDENYLAIGTFNGVLFFNKSNRSTYRIPVYNTSREASPVTAIFLDSRKNLWIGSWGNGFQVYDKQWRKFICPNGQTAKIITGFTETGFNSTSTVWITTSNGLVRFPLGNTEIKENASFHTYLVSVENGIAGGVNAPLTDETGSIWMGGSGESGVLKFYPEADIFKVLPIPLRGVVNDIQPIVLNRKKYYCISSWHDITSLTITDDQWRIVRQFKSLPENITEAGTNSISGVAVDKHQRIWVPTLGGLTVLDSNFKVIKTWGSRDTGINSLTKAKTNAILICGDTVWVACYRSGIDLYNLQFKKLAHFGENENGLKENLLWKFYKDTRNNIWICGNNQLYLFDRSRNEFKAFALSAEPNGCNPRDIAELHDGNLMIASENGLIHFNVDTYQYEYIRSDLLQKEESISSVTIADKKVWFLTTDHLVQYDLLTGRFTLFGNEEGLKPEKGMQIVRFFGPNRLTIGQNDQILQFPHTSAKKITPPKLMITGIQINDSSWAFGSPVRSLSLHHYQNKLYIEFAGITYTKPEQNQYTYQLEGIDKEWVTNNRNFASYANLPPGNYIFKAKASNYAGLWSDLSQIQIRIEPPFWRTWWFISLSVLVVGSLFIFIIRYISQRNLRERILVLEKEQAVEKERNRIARDMHDDLGSGLTKIAILSEVAKKQLNEPQKATNQLENISTSSRELVDNLQDIIWVLNPKNDSLESLAVYIREYSLKFFDSCGMQIHFDYPAAMPTIKLSEEMRRNIFLVIKETFNNTAKHAAGTFVSVQLKTSDNYLEIKIEDNGIGFDQNQVRMFSNGLSNMKTRMEQVGGKYEIESFSGRGTTTRLVCPVA